MDIGNVRIMDDNLLRTVVCRRRSRDWLVEHDEQSRDLIVAHGEIEIEDKGVREVGLIETRRRVERRDGQDLTTTSLVRLVPWR